MSSSDLLSRYAVTTVDSMLLRNHRFDQADFSNQKLEHLRFINCVFEGCRFDLCHFVDLRVWDSTFRDCSFRQASLRGASLGGLVERRSNAFEGARFQQTDLRGSSYVAAVFNRCDFQDANLDKVEFNGSRFSLCRFSGELRETTFADVAFGHEDLDPNQMKEFDFRSAQLRWTHFRRLDLSQALLPQDENHIIRPRFAEFLTCALDRLAARDDLAARKIRSVFEYKLRDAPHAGVGLLNRLDWYEMGQGAGALFDELVHDCA